MKQWLGWTGLVVIIGGGFVGLTTFMVRNDSWRFAALFWGSLLACFALSGLVTLCVWAVST